jgi:hypothetical protein
MWTDKRAEVNPKPRPFELLSLPALLALLFLCPLAATAGPPTPQDGFGTFPGERRPEPWVALFYQSLRATFATDSPAHVENYNGYLDVSRTPDTDQRRLQAELRAFGRNEKWPVFSRFRHFFRTL